MPNYIDSPNDPVWRPPMNASDVTFDCFVYRPPLLGSIALQTKLQAEFERRYALAASNQKVAVQPLVVLIFGRYGAASSTDPAYANRGKVRYNEFAASLVGITLPGGPMPAATPLLATPFLYVDHQLAMIGAREIYGLPKKLAVIDLPTAAAPGSWHCHAEGFLADNGSFPTQITIAKVNQIGPRPVATTYTSWPDAMPAILRGVEALALEGRQPSSSPQESLRSLMPDDLARQVDLTFNLKTMLLRSLTLKQFRHHANFIQADLQRRLVSEFMMTLKTLTLSTGSYSVELPPSASDSVATDLHLPAKFTTSLRVQVKFDAVLGAVTEI